MYLGDDSFVNRKIATLDGDAPLGEVPAAQRRPLPKALDRYAQLRRDRDKAIAAAYASGGYTMKEIGDYFGLHYSMVSRTVKSESDSSFKP